MPFVVRIKAINRVCDGYINWIADKYSIKNTINTNYLITWIPSPKTHQFFDSKFSIAFNHFLL